MESFRLIACETLSHERRTDTYIEPGKTVGECLTQLGWKTDGINARCFIDGQLCQGEWLEATPKAGSAVIVRRIPRGGDGNTGKLIGQIVAMIALVVAAIFAPPALAGLSAMLGASAGTFAGILSASSAITATTLIAGSLAIHATIPPPVRRRALLESR